MRLLVDGKLYDSTKSSILVVFDKNEQEIFNGTERFVSSPENVTEEERQELIDMNIDGINQCPICEEQYEIEDYAIECFKACGGIDS